MMILNTKNKIFLKAFVLEQTHLLVGRLILLSTI